MILIGLTGKKRSGKDTVADFMCQEMFFKKTAFAKPMKEISRIFGFSKDQLDGSLKEIVDDFWGITPRKFLQLLGTEMFRNCFRDDVWLKMMELELANLNTKKAVITDIRFNNEAQFVRKNCGYIIQIIRPDQESDDDHSSEAGIDQELIDHTIMNDGTIQELYVTTRISFHAMRAK